MRGTAQKQYKKRHNTPNCTFIISSCTFIHSVVSDLARETARYAAGETAHSIVCEVPEAKSVKRDGESVTARV